MGSSKTSAYESINRMVESRPLLNLIDKLARMLLEAVKLGEMHRASGIAKCLREATGQYKNLGI